MTLDEAVASFEDGFRLGPAGNHARSATGEPYIEVVSGGVKGERDRAPCYCSSPELAIKLWLEAAREYAPPADRKTLYWRVKPELDELHMLAVEPDGSSKLNAEMRAILTVKVYVVYSRLLVSDKPQIQEAMPAAKSKK